MFVSMLSKLPPVVCLRGEGGGGNRLPVEFPQVQTSTYIITYRIFTNIRYCFIFGLASLYEN